MKHVDIIGKSKIWLGISSVLVVASFVAMGVFGLNFGIDFTGGSLIEVQVDEAVTLDDMRGVVEDSGYDGLVQESQDNIYLIRTATITQEQHDEILAIMNERFESVDEFRFESIGPVIGDELKRKSVGAIVLLLGMIVFYVAWAFRKVSKPVASWKYGVLTIVAAMHDVIIPLGVFAVLGELLGYQIDTAFVAALLTILGYSINDSIVVFDRTRENLVTDRHSDRSFANIVNKSVVQSLSRSINTSVTTMLVLLAIFFFGGETTKEFILALIIGILSGAYSSLFLASPLLVAWEKNKRK